MTRRAYILGSRLCADAHQSALGIKRFARVLKSTSYPFAPKSPRASQTSSLKSFTPTIFSPQSHTTSAFSESRILLTQPLNRYSVSKRHISNQHPANFPSEVQFPKHLRLQKRPVKLENLRQSSFVSWTTVAVIVIVAFTYSAASGFVASEVKPEKSDITKESFGEIGGSTSNMTGESLPGRPGTLTPEQEEKLREFWVAVLQVFGVLDPKELHGDGIAEITNGRARSDTVNSKKPKKKRLSMFRRGGKDEDTDSVASSESGHTRTPSDVDDKYGQTKEFHDALASMSPEILRTTFWSMVKHDHPDALLLRFLRARKWDVEKALVMMVSTMRWRSTGVHVDDDIMKNGELAALEDEKGTDPERKKHAHGFLAQLRMGKSYIHGTDKSGRPMCFVRVRLHKQADQSEESLEKYTVFLIESARMVLAPPVDTACIIFDMTGFSMANMDYAPVKFMIKCFEANYPESLGVVLVHKAPWIFQSIWRIIKGWLDPVVASKVHFTNSNDEMEEFIPKSNIISELGGAEDWTYEYIEPVPGENDLMKDTETRDKLLQGREVLVKDYEKATLAWIYAGTEEATTIKTQRNQLANSLRDDYWRLDPYVRAKSYYDRVGLIQPGGRMQFYPPKAEAPSTNGIVKPIETSADDVD